MLTEPPTVRIIAHRGASHAAPENTLPAFERAWNEGADAIEGDFHLTSDGGIVCIHDPDTKKLDDTRRKIRRCTLGQLRQLDAGFWFGPAFCGVRIPTFEEVAAQVPDGKGLVIEIKCGPEILPPMLAQLQASRLLPEQVEVISFHKAVIAEIKKLAPQYRALWLSKTSRDWRGRRKPSPQALCGILQELGADGVGLQDTVYLDADQIGAVREAGLAVNVWTVDNAGRALELIRFGASSITTNCPGKIRGLLT